MSMEQMGDENERVGLRNQMQAEIARRHGEDLMDFIDKHASDFDIFVRQHNDIFNTYREKPEDALREAERSLYH